MDWNLFKQIFIKKHVDLLWLASKMAALLFLFIMSMRMTASLFFSDYSILAPLNMDMIRFVFYWVMVVMIGSVSEYLDSKSIN